MLTLLFLRLKFASFNAGIAHLVERNLAKVEVTGSSPVTRSRHQKGVLIVLRLRLPFLFLLFECLIDIKRNVRQGGSVVRRRIANPLFASSILAPASNFTIKFTLVCGSVSRDGGTGRRKGLKIPRNYFRAGSTPALGTTSLAPLLIKGFIFFNYP